MIVLCQPTVIESDSGSHTLKEINFHFFSNKTEYSHADNFSIVFGTKQKILFDKFLFVLESNKILFGLDKPYGISDYLRPTGW